MASDRGDRVLGMLGLALRAGMLAVGEEASGTSARTGKVKVLFLAADASGNAERRALAYAAFGSPLVRLPYKKEEISRALGKAGCSMAALTDLGFACEIVEALARRSEPPVGGEPEDNMTEGSENAAARADGTAEVLGGVSGGLDGVLAGLGKR